MTDATRQVGLWHILDTISDGIYVTNARREIVYWSVGAERITGYPAEEVIGKHCYDDLLVHKDLSGKRLCFDGCPLEDCIAHRSERTVNEVLLKRKNGERLPVYVKASTFEEDGEVFGVEIFGELESVAGQDLASQVQALSDSSITDALTGLFNRRYLDAALEQDFALFQRLGRRYGVIQFDIDGFKSVNDTLGHAAGDDAIRFVADVLGSGVRKMDVAARWGGDEFVVICAVSDAEDLRVYGERLLTMIRDSRFDTARDAGLTLTLSAGASLVDDADADADSALRRADHAMYEAKEAGRDRMAIQLAATV